MENIENPGLEEMKCYDGKKKTAVGPQQGAHEAMFILGQFSQAQCAPQKVAHRRKAMSGNVGSLIKYFRYVFQ